MNIVQSFYRSIRRKKNPEVLINEKYTELTNIDETPHDSERVASNVSENEIDNVKRKNERLNSKIQEKELQRWKDENAIMEENLKMNDDEREFQERHKTLLKINNKNVDVAFLLDCTGSMASYILAAQNKIEEIIEAIQFRFNNEIHVAFVGYRDHDDNDTRIEYLDFTNNIETFKQFLGNVKAVGGGDACEDVFGGLEKAIELSWKRRYKCLIHIADAPPHGSRFHDLPKHNDFDIDYDKNDEDRRGLKIERLIHELKKLNIHYFFGRIRECTDKMERVFNGIGGDGFVNGTNMEDLNDFTACITNSITSTIMTLKLQESMGNIFDIERSSDMSNETIIVKYTLNPTVPNWSEISCVNANIEKYIVNLDYDKLCITTKSRNTNIYISPSPFDQGSQRIAYFCLEMGKPDTGFFKHEDRVQKQPNCVVKALKEISDAYHTNKQQYMDIAKTQAICQYYADEFNSKSPDVAKEIQFLNVKLCEVIDEEAENNGKVYTIEEIFPDYEKGYKKYNSNNGFVNMKDYASSLNAFSHWTYVISKGYLMIVDLQGILQDSKYILTDPAVHCKEDIFGRTNMREKGIESFFEMHQCTSICSEMKLPYNEFMKSLKSLPNIRSSLGTNC